VRVLDDRGNVVEDECTGQAVRKSKNGSNGKQEKNGQRANDGR
jgi:hypothetical protein